MKYISCTPGDTDLWGKGSSLSIVYFAAVDLHLVKRHHIQKLYINSVHTLFCRFDDSPEFSKQRAALKRINRSPGGTTCHQRSRNLDTGTGLTPMLTRALRRKFQVSFIRFMVA